MGVELQAEKTARAVLPRRPGLLATSAVSLGVLAATLVAVPSGVVAVAYAVGAARAVEDTRLAAVLGAGVAAGVVGSLAAFGMAVLARARHETWTMLWLPSLLFPVVVVLLALGESFWWE